MKNWIRIALEPSVVRRAMWYAGVVGAILIAINHGDAILRGNVTAVRFVKMGLTVLVPYLVSTLSSVGAISEFRDSDPKSESASDEKPSKAKNAQSREAKR